MHFDFNQERILEVVEEASKLGIELFVLDDGWFGKRNSDTGSLGNWTENKEKLPDGLAHLTKAIKEKGMLFGLWFEPEMVSDDTDLFKEHLDWVIGNPEKIFRMVVTNLCLTLAIQKWLKQFIVKWHICYQRCRLITLS